MPFLLCADFSLFPDDHQLGPSFTLSQMDFQDAAGAASRSFVNLTSGLKGLQFPDAGIEVTLPLPSPYVRLHLGQFNAPYTVESLDPAGTVTGTQQVNNPNSYFYVNFGKADTQTVRLTGGGNEGVILSLCILIP